MRERVLVVEDEALVALTMETVLEDAGFEVADTVVSGQAAIDACDAQTPAVVLMDINLKGPMDGIEAARLVRERCGVQVVFVTGQGDAATRERAMAGGPAGYLRKPFTPEALVAAVRAALRPRGEAAAG
ncbi:response regulator [Caulobacter sp. 17J65-9]|uniref:response regulator n=1 Tax=Caulobacter sp. 17J65-9 TaxID=2709382 RepID=UPI0013CBC6D9|nr:response regulator [Caulobacter sp. 17J65-9]